MQASLLLFLFEEIFQLVLGRTNKSHANNNLGFFLGFHKKFYPIPTKQTCGPVFSHMFRYSSASVSGDLEHRTLLPSLQSLP